MYISPITRLYKKPEISNIGKEIDEKIANECIQIAYEWGIDINKEDLIKALTADQKRYEEAYKLGYETCKKDYSEKLEALINESH